MSEGGDDETIDRPPRVDPRAPTVAADAPIERLLHFRVVARLGDGGMGVVYRAFDEKLRRHVAIKVLAEKYLVDDRNAKLLFREARAAAAVSHPNIAAVYEVHDATRPPFLVMELLEGETLRARADAQGALPADAILALARPIARALAAAHGAGVVHRDLKPENVMITRAGEIKLLDFGIAKVLESAAGEAEIAFGGTASVRHSVDGRIVGTPEYMSPEQALGRPIDARTDVFAFGVMLYELASGVRPFRRARVMETLVAVSRDEAGPLAKVAPKVPRELAAIVDRCMAKDVDARFASGAELARALDALTLDPRAARGERRAGRAWALAATAAAALGVMAWAARGPHAVVGPPSVGASDSSPARCATNRECGAGSICRASACVPLAPDGCEVLASDLARARDDTVWLGAMFPRRNAIAPELGASNVRAIDLARREIDDVMGPLAVDRTAPARVRPIGVVACADDDAPARAADHLVNALGVPAVIGFASSGELLDLAGSLFLPRRVLAVSSLNMSPLFASLPHPPDGPRLVWRTTYSSASAAAPIAGLVARVLEPRARRGSGAAAVRVAVVRDRNAAARAFADALYASLRFNGRPALENGEDLREVVVGEDGSAVDRAAVDALVAFRPHVVVFQGAVTATLLEAERRGLDRATLYADAGTLDADLLAYAAAVPTRRARFLGLAARTSSAVHARFLLRYRAAYGDAIAAESAPDSSYDALYLLAFATYALGDEPPSGAALARAMRRLIPPGRRVEVGPSSIFDAFNALRAGESIDVVGATGDLDFDPETGDAPVDMEVVCAGAGASGAIENVDAGLAYVTRARRLEGVLRCP